MIGIIMILPLQKWKVTVRLRLCAKWQRIWLELWSQWLQAWPWSQFFSLHIYVVRDTEPNSLEGCPMHCLLPIFFSSYLPIRTATAMMFRKKTSAWDVCVPSTILLGMHLSSLTHRLLWEAPWRKLFEATAYNVRLSTGLSSSLQSKTPMTQ